MMKCLYTFSNSYFLTYDKRNKIVFILQNFDMPSLLNDTVCTYKEVYVTL